MTLRSAATPKELVLLPPAPPCAVHLDTSRPAIALDQATLATAYMVHAVVCPHGGAEWPQRLEEIGFLPGERVSVMARGQPGNDPLAVRVGHSTFALRRAEAACVQVLPWPGSGSAR